MLWICFICIYIYIYLFIYIYIYIYIYIIIIITVIIIILFTYTYIYVCIQCIQMAQPRFVQRVVAGFLRLAIDIGYAQLGMKVRR